MGSDNLGGRGRKRLWLPKKESREAIKERFEESQMVESKDKVKNASDQVVDEMRIGVVRGNSDGSDAFFDGGPARAQQRKSLVVPWAAQPAASKNRGRDSDTDESMDTIEGALGQADESSGSPLFLFLFLNVVFLFFLLSQS